MFSKELEQSISNLFDEAQKSNIEYITIEHLLLMILNDFDVKESLLDSLKKTVDISINPKYQ